MAIPQWTYDSNSSLGTFQERLSLSVPILVFDNEDRSTVETSQFENAVDSTIIQNYANRTFFWIKSNGLAQTSWQGNPPGYLQQYAPREQSYVFKIPRDQVDIYGQLNVDRANTETPALGFIGVAIDGVPFKSPNSGKKASIGGTYYTENAVEFPIQDYYTDGSGPVGADRKFYYHSDPALLYTKDPSQHSNILGYAFDGNPIYGPYAYSDPTDVNSEIKVMKSSYRFRDEQRVNETIPDGTFIEDFVYESGLGDLDQYNGRFCITPDYPGGIYAYFVTVDPDDGITPQYPYIIGPKYFNEPLIPNGSFEFPGDITLSVISGELPPGLRIEGLYIKGTPFEVSRLKTYRFVLRAINLDGLSDRTYSMGIDGPDAPVWITPTGDLEVGTTGHRTETIIRALSQSSSAGTSTIRLVSVFNLKVGSIITARDTNGAIQANTKISDIDKINKIITIDKPLLLTLPGSDELTSVYSYQHTNLWVLDNSLIDYQLSAIDNDLPTGQKLTFYIPPKGGQLPPGITLSPDGKLYGFTEPVLAADQGDGTNGFYDKNFYDKFAYDYGVRPYNGYDSFFYDNQTYDFSDTTRTPRKLNRYYQFVVRATDGISYVDRRFRIYVVGDDFFRADDTIMRVGTGTYSADATYVRKPIWITPPYLGRRRANNYITTFLDVFDPATLQGKIGYILDEVNDDGTISTLPPGMMLDQLSGEIYGDVPFQPAITRSYKFTVRAVRYDPQSTTFGIEKYVAAKAIVGQTTLKLNSIDSLRVGGFVTSPTGHEYVSPGTTITSIDTYTNIITLSLPLLDTITAGEKLIFSYVVSSARTFTIDIIGEVDSTIRFLTSGNLGIIPANFVSALSVEALSTVPNAVLTYTLIGGKLPPGLTLVNDGSIQGKVNQYATEDAPGLTTFDNITTSFDGSTTTVDREYTFIVLAQDQFQYSAVTKIFTVAVTTPNNLLYSNLYAKPFLKVEKRLELADFFTNPDIFERNLLYRPSDPEFGVQTQLKVLLYAGIETLGAGEYAAKVRRSSKKRFRFGAVKKSIAKIPGTNDIMYEVVYVEIIDNMENSKGSVSNSIITRYGKHPLTVNQGKRDVWDSSTTDDNLVESAKDVAARIWKQDVVMTADYDGQLISDFNKSTVYGNSVTNIRKSIESLGETERNFLPLWMRTPQTFSGVEQGFTKAVVLCYCRPQTAHDTYNPADRVIINIKNLGIDFKNVDFTVDRLIIDSVANEVGDKYIAFGAREVING